MCEEFDYFVDRALTGADILSDTVLTSGDLMMAFVSSRRLSPDSGLSMTDGLVRDQFEGMAFLGSDRHLFDRIRNYAGS